MRVLLVGALLITSISAAAVSLTSFDVWKPGDWTRSDTKQLVLLDDEIIVAGGR